MKIRNANRKEGVRLDITAVLEKMETKEGQMKAKRTTGLYENRTKG